LKVATERATDYFTKAPAVSGCSSVGRKPIRHG
jgi:hypothetical protein